MPESINQDIVHLNDIKSGTTINVDVENQSQSDSPIDDDAHHAPSELHQGLKARHIQMIALGGCIGTGLFVNSGAALAKSGPAGLFTSYLIMSTVIYFIMNQLGEIVCYLPTSGGAVSDIVVRYVDESLGFATGWIYYYTFVMMLCTEVTATALVVSYWTDKVSNGVWITVFLIVIVGLNFLAVKFYGESEFWFSSLKILCILGLIILGIVIFFGGGPNQHGVLGFHYWKTPGPFAEHLSHGSTARFLDVWSGVIKSAFGFVVAPELVAIAAAETQNPRRNIAKASKRFIHRLTFFYAMGSLVVSVIVPYNHPNLLNGESTAAASPYVIGIQNAGIKGLNHVINAVILTAAWSSGNSFLYASSRSLLSLAKEGKAPRIFLKINRHGVPYVATAFSSLIACLAYLNVSSSSQKVFNWFSNIATISGFIGWIIISIVYLRWRKAVIYNGLWDRVPFKTCLQPYSTYYSLGLVIIICITNGYAVFFGEFSAPDFVAAYITLPVFFLLYFGHKIFTNNWKWAYPIQDIDVVTGLDEVEFLTASLKTPRAGTFYERVWEYLM